MITGQRMNLGAFPDSPYAAELHRGRPKLRFSPKLEAEYARAHLIDSRTLIRMTCVVGILLGTFHTLEQVIARPWTDIAVLRMGSVIACSIILTLIAWSPAFERLYLPWARITVPLRNAIIASLITEAAARGQLEMLMVLPLAVIGPFFFLGLSFRTALLCGVLTTASFIAHAVFFGLTGPVALHACVFLLIALAGSVIAARHLERWSRTSFLETHVIAELAQHDALTGMKNRRVFDEHLARLWAQALEERRAIAILVIDVDHFKAYNDRYGHQAGDQALRRVAQAAQSFVCRPLDVLARYGGEEFAAVLYDMDGNRAMDLAERMRRAVEELNIEHRASRACDRVTISVGIAAIEPSPGRNPHGALQLADQALYGAKVKGRNRIELMNDAEHRMLVTGVFSTADAARNVAPDDGAPESAA